MPASTTDVRAWAVEEGLDVKPKGNLSKDVWSQYAAAHPASDDGYDGPEGETGAAPPPGDTGEQAPRPPARPAGSVRKRVTGLFARDKKPGRRRARIPLDGFAENMWTDLAQVAPWPPLQIILSVQGAYAATVFDDVVKGTFIDPLVQPVARADATLRALDGLLGPPLVTAMICVAGQQQTDGQGIPLFDTAGWPVWDGRTKLMFGMLKYSLMQMSRVTDAKLEQIEEKAAEINERSASADRLIAMMFAMTRKPAGQEGDGGPDVPPVPEETVRQAGNGQGRPRPGFLYPLPPQMDDTGTDPGRT
jgi:hypothetical protein